MSIINIPTSQKEALKAIDKEDLDRIILQAARGEGTGGLNRSGLQSCGPYVARKLSEFEQALMEHGRSRTTKKRIETEDIVRNAGRSLSDAVWKMKERVESDEKDNQIFYIDDIFLPPGHLQKRLTVRVDYRWRRTVDDEWQFDSITFVYDYEVRRHYAEDISSKKISAAKKKQDLENDLYQTWELVRNGALCSVRDYFRAGKDGSLIPKKFQVRPDKYHGGLNNYSTQFWIEP